MTGTRRNILTSTADRDNFLQGLVALDEPTSGITAGDVFQFLQNNLPGLRMRGIQQELSIYDLFVLWHVVAMSFPMPPGNGAHSGPIFLPWHRMFLIRLEEWLQRVLNDDDFGLPYWDWAADGELAVEDQVQAQIWSDSYLGEAVGDVVSGICAQMRVRLWYDGGMLHSISPRPIQRAAGSVRVGDTVIDSLPQKSDVTDAMEESRYDRSPWSQSVVSHRNRLEGWLEPPQLHNRVHVWIAGDMGPPTSPNDPAFFLNHCNVDRIWEAWMADNEQAYEPVAGEGPTGHRVNDRMIAVLGETLTPQEVLDPSLWYSYDNLSVD